MRSIGEFWGSRAVFRLHSNLLAFAPFAAMYLLVRFPNPLATATGQNNPGPTRIPAVMSMLLKILIFLTDRKLNV